MRYLVVGLMCVLALAVGCGDGGPACETDAQCDDGNQCTQDLCDDGSCFFPDEPDGTPCARDCMIGVARCYDGECGSCVYTCSSVHRDDAPGGLLLAVLALLGIRFATRREAKGGTGP